MPIPRINISGLLEEMAMEPPPQTQTRGTQHISGTVQSLQTKLVERMKSFGTSLMGMARPSYQRAVMRRDLISSEFPTKLTARATSGRLKTNAEVLKEWDWYTLTESDCLHTTCDVLTIHWMALGPYSPNITK